MVDDVALSSRRAFAGADASFVSAGKISGTLRVSRALGSLAVLIGIAVEALPTVAAGLVVSINFTEGIGAALSYQASVDALAVDARLAQGALVVGSAADLDTAQMCVTGVSLLTDTNGSVQLDVALAVLAASVEGARAHALLVVAGLVVRAVGVASAFWFWH